MQLASVVHSSGPADPSRPARHHYSLQELHTHHRPLSNTTNFIVAHSNNAPSDYSFYRRPNSPPSPPVEEMNKPSLPSISSLLTLANSDRSAGDSGVSQAEPSQTRHSRPSPKQNAFTAVNQDAQHSASKELGATTVSNPRMTLPPTPPMYADAVVDGNQSPSSQSAHSSFSAQPYYIGSALNNTEPHQQRQQAIGPPMSKRESLPSQPSMSPYSNTAYVTSPYASSPGAASVRSAYSPEHHIRPPPPPSSSQGLYQQRALPNNFPPPVQPVVAPTSSYSSNPLQHHHYISASSQAAFPQSQDRYICSTCNKAFSRPSSLRIHSHSHTGEKPYKCPQPGCGKAFSVRSNMKRHEKGCHAALGGITPS